MRAQGSDGVPRASVSRALAAVACAVALGAVALGLGGCDRTEARPANLALASVEPTTSPVVCLDADDGACLEKTKARKDAPLPGPPGVAVGPARTPAPTDSESALREERKAAAAADWERVEEEQRQKAEAAFEKAQQEMLEEGGYVPPGG